MAEPEINAFLTHLAVKEKGVMVYEAQWMGFELVYTVCINRELPMERNSVTSWNERC